MSLAVLADHMASKGRGPDSMLIHMSPNEVAGLQSLAMANGGSLTINPETGLPEAGFLDKLLPTIIGAGLTLAGVPPNVSAMIVGGIQTVRTGDLGKGIQAGLGAYGGANLTSSMTAAGSSAIGSEAAGQSYLSNYAPPGAIEGASAGLSADMAYNLADAGVNTLGEGAAAANQAATSAVEAATPYQKLARGFDTTVDQFKNSPMQALKANAKDMAYAFGPAILAEMSAKQNMPQTTTKPGMITPYSYFNGQFVPGQAYEASPTRAAEGGLMGMNAGGYAPGQLDFAQRSEPVVRMAEGGIAGYAAGGGIDQILADAARLRAATASTAPAQAVAIPGVVDTTRPGQYVTDPATGNAVALSAYSPGFDPNNKITQTYLGELAAGGGKDTTSQMFNQMGASKAQQDANASAWATEKARLDAIDAANAAKAPTGLAALANIPDGASYTNKFFAERGLGFDPIDKSIDNFFAEYTDDLALMSPQQQEKVMRDALATERMNEADVVKATGKTIAQHIQQKTGNLNTVLPKALPGGVSGAGNTVVNPNGTITTSPDIPGIPDGGFTGMKDVRDAYTKGGGSLGYTSPTFASLKAVEEKYPLRGAAKQSYDYLMGREDYSPVPYTKDGQIAKPYAESVLKMPVASSSKMYIFKDGKFVPNPDYAIPTYDSKGVKSSNLTNADVKTYMNTKPSPTDFYTWATTNNLSPEQIALASDMPISEVSKMYTGAKKEAGTAKSGDTIQVTDTSGYDTQTYTAVKQSDGTYLAGNGKRYDASGKEIMAAGGLAAMARGGMSQQFDLGGYSDGGRLLRGPGDGVSDSIPATIGNKRPARLADGEFVVPARIVSELGNGSTEAGARKLYAMMDRVQAARRGTVGKGRVAKNSRADKHLPA